ncbi:MAG: hypothetical protein J3K34DRAFT_426460 [Monoraphidium minutum]|nr:MAG: hypothetical protein J3K34DRAFT_426460 [Monoraphidium minutum]
MCHPRLSLMPPIPAAGALVLALLVPCCRCKHKPPLPPAPPLAPPPLSCASRRFLHPCHAFAPCHALRCFCTLRGSLRPARFC